MSYGILFVTSEVADSALENPLFGAIVTLSFLYGIFEGMEEFTGNVESP
jgi:hypothetical protein